MNALVEDRKKLQKIVESFDVHRDGLDHRYVRQKLTAGGTASAKLLPLAGANLAGAIQAEFERAEGRSISLLMIKDAIAGWRAKSRNLPAQDVQRVVSSTALHMSQQGSESLILRTATDSAVWVTQREWSEISAAGLESSCHAVFIDHGERPEIGLASIALKELQRRKASPPPLPNIDPVKKLWSILEDDFPALGQEQARVVAAWLLGALTPVQMPMLVINGPRGSGKTFMASVLASLFARGKRYNRDLPRRVQDLHDRLCDEIVVLFDNVRNISPAVSDELCRLMTGGYIAKRGPNAAAYGHLDMARLIMTSIHNPVEAEDLASRCLVIDLPTHSPPQNPQSAKPLREAAAIAHDIGVALLDAWQKTFQAMAQDPAARNRTVPPPYLQLNSKNPEAVLGYRFQDFLKHTIKVERCVRDSVEMAAAVISAVETADDASAEDEPLVILLKEFLAKQPKGEFNDTARTLIKKLKAFDEDGEWSSQPFLRNPRSMSVALKNLRHTLSARKISYQKLGARDHYLKLETWSSPTPTKGPKTVTPLQQDKNRRRSGGAGQKGRKTSKS